MHSSAPHPVSLEMDSGGSGMIHNTAEKEHVGSLQFSTSKSNRNGRGA